MQKSEKKMLLFVVMFLVAAMTVGGLGNAAVVYQKIYWIPCVINIFVYIYILYKIFKTGDKAGVEETKEKEKPETGGAPLPPTENEKVDNIVETVAKKPSKSRKKSE